MIKNNEPYDANQADPQGDEWRRALAALGEDARPREDCPASETLWRGVAGELDPAELGPVLDHVATCPVCAEAWDLAGELQRGDEAGAPRSGVDTPDPANDDDEGFWRPWLQVAALVVVLLGAGLLLPRGFLPDETPSSVYRGGPEPLAALTPQDVPQPKDDLVLRWVPWEPVAGGSAVVEYEVRLLQETPEVTHLLLHLSGRRTTLEVPAGSLAHLPVGTRLLWEVVAFEDQEAVARRTYPVTLGEPGGSADATRIAPTETGGESVEDAMDDGTPSVDDR